MSGIDERISSAFNAGHDFPLRPSLVFLCSAGSSAHGTYVPPSQPDAIDDVDLMGVLVPPLRYTFGGMSFDHWNLQRDELDVVCYSLQRITGLLLKANPNVLATLWIAEKDCPVITPVWAAVRERRALFATKAAYESFAGYANGQLHRMTSYSPELDAEMQRLEGELEAAGWHLQDVMDRRSVPMPRGITPDEANNKAQRLRSLRARYHAAYMGEKRRSLVQRHGYDTKNAAHLVRLLTMCREFMGDGVLRVDRTGIDAHELRAIKRGDWPLDRVKAYAESLFSDCRAARDASPLPDAPDRRAVAELVSDAHLMFYALTTTTPPTPTQGATQ